MNAKVHSSALSGLNYIWDVMQGKRPQAGFEQWLNFRITRADEGLITVLAEPKENFTNPMKTLHGGYFATLLDAAMGAAVHTTLSAEQDFTTVELKVNFMKPARPPFSRIHANGSIRKAGRRIVFVEGHIYSDSDELLASGSATCLVWTMETPEIAMRARGRSAPA